jgi:hypothetical protein
VLERLYEVAKIGGRISVDEARWPCREGFWRQRRDLRQASSKSEVILQRIWEWSFNLGCCSITTIANRKEGIIELEHGNMPRLKAYQGCD